MPSVLRLPPVLALLAAALPALAQDQAPAGRWAPAGELSVGRYAPGACLLDGGKVLVAGGYSFETDRTHVTSESFDPETGAWSDGPRMRFDRNFPLVLPLPDGGALFTAGYRRGVGTTATSERIDPRGTRFRSGAEEGAPPAVEERELCSVTRLSDGRYLIAGGYSTLRRKTLESAEVFDPKTERFAAVGGMTHPRFGHDGVLLQDGRVLIVGGKVLATNADVLPAELFDPAKGSFTVTAALTTGRDRCTGWRMPDGIRVIVAGGSAREGGTLPARRSEIYDPRTGRFAPGPELLRDRMAHTATPLPDGRVLLAGGWSGSEGATTRQAELWDPRSERFVPAGSMQVGRHDHAAVLLRDGRVLIAGGKEAPARNGVETPLAAEIWSP